MAHSPDYDFIGFTFGEKWFKDINVLHVSDGSRYNDNLAPTMQDKTVQVPGGHGTYYFGSYYTQRTFSVQIAYDSITEQDLRTLRQMTNWGVQKLVFDEQPYKTYYAKMTGTPQLKYICFDEGAVNRVYKGEGTLQFTCFEPFAHCVEGQKFEEYWLSTTPTDIPIPDTDPIEYEQRRIYPNAEEWLPASGIVPQGNYDNITNQGQVDVYNAGDIATDFQLYYEFDENDSLNIAIKTNHPDETIPRLQKQTKIHFRATKKGNDTFVRVNSKNHLIEGMVGNLEEGLILSGNIYNEGIIEGDFFKLPAEKDWWKGANHTLDVGTSCKKIEYDYLYL